MPAKCPASQSPQLLGLFSRDKVAEAQLQEQAHTLHLPRHLGNMLWAAWFHLATGDWLTSLAARGWLTGFRGHYIHSSVEVGDLFRSALYTVPLGTRSLISKSK